MTTSRGPYPSPDGAPDAAMITRVEEENLQLRRAVGAHATVDQAIGVLAALCRVPPAAGFEVLREVSQRTNIKLRSVAETVIGWALGQPLKPPVGPELDAAVQRWSQGQDGPDLGGIG
ncbi:ANTAR domain-containing protein [Streptomyces sp. NPDC002769]|uniref:ANTAR domain-containing protein n=1 Tax=Streptomyces sp. NPDC002769 TaxID=3154542 RepID=UPI0033296ED6